MSTENIATTISSEVVSTPPFRMVGSPNPTVIFRDAGEIFNPDNNFSSIEFVPTKHYHTLKLSHPDYKGVSLKKLAFRIEYHTLEASDAKDNDVFFTLAKCCHPGDESLAEAEALKIVTMLNQLSKTFRDTLNAAYTEEQLDQYPEGRYSMWNYTRVSDLRIKAPNVFGMKAGSKYDLDKYLDLQGDISLDIRFGWVGTPEGLNQLTPLKAGVTICLMSYKDRGVTISSMARSAKKLTRKRTVGQLHESAKTYMKEGLSRGENAMELKLKWVMLNFEECNDYLDSMDEVAEPPV